MPLKVSDIFAQKMAEIQSRVPIKINTLQTKVPFQEFLDDALTPYEPDSQLGVSDLERAKSSKVGSKADTPADKVKLMETIENNIVTASRKYGVDPNLIRAVIKQESGFNPYSLSTAGAQGLMQLMPGTADALNVSDPWDIAQNIDGGVKYLKDQLATFNGDLKLALAAYNAGPNSVNKYNGIPPYRETRDYVTRVMQYYRQYAAGG